MMKVGITGGIGSGKSTVCRLFAARGVAVYDSDAAAKRLMAGPLRGAVEARFGAQAYRDGVLDRRYLAGIVFRARGALQALGAIVHPAVMRDFEAWAEAQQGDYVVLESAILFEAGLEKSVDRTVAVLAPEALRIQRTWPGDGTDAESVGRRIAAQMSDDELHARADHTIVNIREEELAPAVEQLDRLFRLEARHHDA